MVMISQTAVQIWIDSCSEDNASSFRKSKEVKRKNKASLTAVRGSLRIEAETTICKTVPGLTNRKTILNHGLLDKHSKLKLF